MGFRGGGGIDPNTTTVTGGGTNVDVRRRIIAPDVIGPTGPSGGPGKPILSPEAGLFGGSLPPSRAGTEKRAKMEGDAARFESYHPPRRTPGPLLLGEQGTGATPVHPLPAHAAAVFAAMSARGAR